MNRRLLRVCSLILCVGALASQSVHAMDKWWNTAGGKMANEAISALDREAGAYIDRKKDEMRELQRVINTPIPAKQKGQTKTEYKAQLDDLQARKKDAREALENLKEELVGQKIL